MAEEVEEEVVGVKRRKFEEVEDVEEVAAMKRRAEEEEVATVKKRKAEVEESPLAKKGRLDEETEVDNLPASLLSLSDDVILGVLRWANINNPHIHVVVIILIFGENAPSRMVLTYIVKGTVNIKLNNKNFF